MAHEGIRIESFDHEATHQCGRGSNVSEQTANNGDIERIVFYPLNVAFFGGG
jgi:hypothetical protein